MAAFVGKWKTTGLPENYEAYAKALQLNDQQKADLVKGYEYHVGFDSNTQVLKTTMIREGSDPFTSESKLGEQATVNSPFMGEIKVTVTLEGNDKLKSTQLIGPVTQVMISTVSGNNLTVVTEIGDVKMTGHLVKI